MGKKQSVFERVEKKYLLSSKQYSAILEELKPYTTADKYEKCVICNIYFDTDSFNLIRNSIEKPIYKEKLRLRSYGVPQLDDKVFVELKKKFRKTVFKRREEMSLGAAYRFLCGRIPPEKPTQITNEIDWTFNFYNGLKPKMFISYDRVAMVGNADKSLRITFDSHLLWRTEALDLTSGVWGNSLLPNGERIMEIKILGAMPLWLAEILSKLEIFPCSYSKYGTAYCEFLANSNKGEIICA